jgi:hypothetical protein
LAKYSWQFSQKIKLQGNKVSTLVDLTRKNHEGNAYNLHCMLEERPTHLETGGVDFFPSRIILTGAGNTRAGAKSE